MPDLSLPFWFDVKCIYPKLSVSLAALSNQNALKTNRIVESCMHLQADENSSTLWHQILTYQYTSDNNKIPMLNCSHFRVSFHSHMANVINQITLTLRDDELTRQISVGNVSHLLSQSVHKKQENICWAVVAI